jgi:hypothetical protein
MRGFHDLLREKSSSLLILLGWSLISVASLAIRSIYLDLLARMLVLCSWMRWPRFMVCSTTADFSGCWRRMCQ